MGVELVSWPIPPSLRGDVVRISGYEERLEVPVTYRYPPGTFVPVIVNAGSPYRLSDSTGVVEQHRSFTAGMGEGWTDVESTRAALGVQVDLTPLAACRLLRVAMHELAGRVVSLADVLGRDADRLEEQLADAHDWDERRAVAEALLARLRSAPPLPADVEYAWRRLHETGGSIRVTELAAEVRCSRKHLDARFREAVGIPPKATAAVVRFNRAVGLLEAGEKPAEVAARCGYSDQPHLTREFRRFAGTTPVAFLQDAAAVAA
jgi:AraC-like DNA-binding protein